MRKTGRKLIPILIMALLFSAFLGVAGCSSNTADKTGQNTGDKTGQATNPAQPSNPNQGLTVSSPAFADGDEIPLKYVSGYYNGQNLNPPLNWTNAPAGTRSFVVMVFDASANNYLHWAVINIPPTATSIPEAATSDTLPPGSTQLMNQTNRTPSYSGPVPPQGSGVHLYYFKVYALDVDSLAVPSVYKDANELSDMMLGHVLASQAIVGKFSK